VKKIWRWLKKRKFVFLHTVFRKQTKFAKSRKVYCWRRFIWHALQENSMTRKECSTGVLEILSNWIRECFGILICKVLRAPTLFEHKISETSTKSINGWIIYAQKIVKHPKKNRKVKIMSIWCHIDQFISCFDHESMWRQIDITLTFCSPWDHVTWLFRSQWIVLTIIPLKSSQHLSRKIAVDNHFMPIISLKSVCKWQIVARHSNNNYIFYCQIFILTMI